MDKEELIKILAEMSNIWQLTEKISGNPVWGDCARDLDKIIEKAIQATRMGSLQKGIGQWGAQTFPTCSLNGVVNHLYKEVLELSEDHDPEEAADCCILLFQHAYNGGYDLLDEVRKKFEINKTRKWGEPDEFGIIEHVKEGEGD